MSAEDEFIAWEELQEKLSDLRHWTEKNDVNAVRLLLSSLVVGYSPAAEILDLVHEAKS